MTSSRFDKFLQANRNFFAQRLARFRDNPDSLYVDPALNDVVALNAILRIAIAVAEIKELKPVVMATRWGFGKESRIIRSFAIPRLASTFGAMLSGCMNHPIALWRCFHRVVDGRRLVALTVESHPIGKHIYDHLLRRHRLPMLQTLSLRLRIEAVAEMAYCFGLERILDRNRCVFAILGDNTYRQGIAFELLKERGIPSLCAINLNGMSAHLYRGRRDYLNHCRTPDAAIVRMVGADPTARLAAVAALEARTAGREIQHDLVRAYGSDKRTPPVQTLKQELGVAEGKKMVLVMAHIFQDAPHAYPGTLFHDYSQWLIETCARLIRNPDIVVIVKEHPSVELYSEQGRIDEVVAGLSPGRIRIVKNINTRSFFDCADVVVTCGGTCGIEFPCYGVPVVVAARPPYSQFSFITKTDTQQQYLTVLDNIHRIPRLTHQQIDLARTVFYVLQRVQKVDKRALGLGSQGITLGKANDEDRAWEEMLDELAEGDGYTRLVAYLNRFFASGLLNFVDESFLSIHAPGALAANAVANEVLVG